MNRKIMREWVLSRESGYMSNQFSLICGRAIWEAEYFKEYTLNDHTFPDMARTSVDLQLLGIYLDDKKFYETREKCFATMQKDCGYTDMMKLVSSKPRWDHFCSHYVYRFDEEEMCSNIITECANVLINDSHRKRFSMFTPTDADACKAATLDELEALSKASCIIDVIGGNYNHKRFNEYKETYYEEIKEAVCTTKKHK